MDHHVKMFVSTGEKAKKANGSSSLATTCTQQQQQLTGQARTHTWASPQKPKFF